MSRILPHRHQMAGRARDDGGTTSFMKKRNKSRELSRIALLEATARVVLEHGIDGTTVSRIQRESGLSRGMINLHFDSKENLIAALQDHLGDKYDEVWNALASTHITQVDTPREAARLLARLIAADLSQPVLTLESARLAFIFRARRQRASRYPNFVETRNTPLQQLVRHCVDTLCRSADMPDQADSFTATLLALLEGLWTDFHMHPDDFDRNQAIALCIAVCESRFPDQFGAPPIAS